jgi:5-methylcytosine-specific restriction protein A
MTHQPKQRSSESHILLARELTRDLGVEISIAEFDVAGGTFLGARFVDLVSPNGFTLLVSESPRGLTCELWLDTFALPLLQDFSASDDEDRKLFSDSIRTLTERGLNVTLAINSSEISVDEPLPPAPWRHIEFEAQKFVPKTAFGRSNELRDLLRDVCSLFLCLLELSEEEGPLLEDADLLHFASKTLGEVEGRKIVTKLTRYERSRKNRRACINYFGSSCQICGLNFGEFYGAVGDGYVEVHHRLPVSMMESAYRLDVVKDLIPVCANCHRMMHRQWPPLTPEDLGELILETNSKNRESESD